MESIKSLSQEFCDNFIILMKSIEGYRGICLIAFSVKFHGYKRLQKLILIIFTNHDFSNLVFFSFLMIWFLKGYSEHYKSYLEFPGASIDLLDIGF